MKRAFSLLLAALLLLTGCGVAPQTSEPSSAAPTHTTFPTQSPEVALEVLENGCTKASPEKVYTFPDNRPLFSLDGTFYSTDILVELFTETDAVIYYTLDGSEPDETDLLYTSEGILFRRQRGDFPNAHTIKARAYYANGIVSDVAVKTYFSAKNIRSRFTTLVFSVSGEPDVLTEGPDGIFYGENYHQRGRESEREIYLEAWNTNGEQFLSQYCGVRVYGGASRAGSIKSMKLYARKSYSSGDGKFDTDIFGTLVQDGSGDMIDEYDKMVLRNGGNDFQFAYIRDEMCHLLAKDAGFTDYEMVIPAVCYMNGEYYGFFWLHESYCDDYFKNKYPNDDANGEFIVCEGTDRWKNEDPDEGKEVFANHYNRMYDVFSKADLTVDNVYAQLCEFIDVENYLDYFAFNIYINNWDWPQNNYKCYRYCPAEGEEFDGVYDGRWRYLLHDTDYSFGLYGMAETQAQYDNISQILNPDSDRYAPLFANLLHRADCREYFLAKLEELAFGALSSQNILNKINTIMDQRATEQAYYYTYMEQQRNAGVQDLWSRPEHMEDYVALIRTFASKRARQVISYAKKALEAYE